MVESGKVIAEVSNITTTTTTDGGEVIHPYIDKQRPSFPPLVSSYNDKIRPILDAVDKLRRLNVNQEGIPLPTIVVVGDQSSGKSSVLESLAGISLPRGQGICTRVPLIMRLQHHSGPVPEFLLEFQKKTVKINEESRICKAIDKATVEVAGNSKGISNIPLTLVVKKRGVPDLTMVDLPGITRVPVHDQPQDIYKQISDMIMEYIEPEESIILNVLSATVDFPTCESIRMSRCVDSTGKRTLAVVTKSDRSPDGLLEKVTADDVNIGLGYVCVRNRINDETFDEARIQEAKLFDTHPLLSKIDKSMVGTPVLAKKLVQIQSIIISKCLPDVVKKINEKLDGSVQELNKLPRSITSIPEAMAAFMHMVASLKGTLQKILIKGEIDEYADDKQMHCNAKLVKMLDEFSNELHTSVQNSDFLVEEMEVLEESNGIRLPHFLPHSAFLSLLHRKVNSISELPVNFVKKVWDYLETIFVKILVDRCGNFPQLLPYTRKAIQHVLAKAKDHFVERVCEMIEMEKITDYTCDPDFIASWNKLMGNRDVFLKAMNVRSEVISIEGFGSVKVKHLFTVPTNQRDQSFDLKMRMTAYWKIVLKRMVDWLALQLRFQMQKMVNKDIEIVIVNEVIMQSGGIEKMLEESPTLARKRERLHTSIGLLKESKEIVERVMDDIRVTN